MHDAVNYLLSSGLSPSALASHQVCILIKNARGLFCSVQSGQKYRRWGITPRPEVIVFENKLETYYCQ